MHGDKWEPDPDERAALQLLAKRRGAMPARIPLSAEGVDEAALVRLAKLGLVERTATGGVTLTAAGDKAAAAVLPRWLVRSWAQRTED